MTPLLTFTVDGTPQGARRHRAARRGSRVHMHHEPEHVAAEQRIAWTASGQLPLAITLPVRLVIETWHRLPRSRSNARKWWGQGEAPYRGKPDADNIAKLVMDALTKARVWTDDTVVAQLEVRRWWVAVDAEGVQGPERTCVTVEGL